MVHPKSSTYYPSRLSPVEGRELEWAVVHPNGIHGSMPISPADVSKIINNINILIIIIIKNNCFLLF